jgi:hypothetical protein
MTPNGKTWLAEIRNDPKFKQVMKEIRQLRPPVSKYRPQISQEANSELVERIKYESGKQDGFDLVFLLFTGEQIDG